MEKLRAARAPKRQKLDRVMRKHFASLRAKLPYVLALSRIEKVLACCQMLYPAGKKSVRVRIRRTHTSGRRYYFEIVPLSPAKRWEQDYQRVCEFLPLAYGRRLATTLALILKQPEYDYEIDFVELGRRLESAMERKERQFSVTAPLRPRILNAAWRRPASET